MNIIVSIPDEKYYSIINSEQYSSRNKILKLYESIEHMSTLPQQYGKLIDADKLINELSDKFNYSNDSIPIIVIKSIDSLERPL